MARGSICSSPSGIVLDFAREFFPISQEKKELFGAADRFGIY